MKLTNLLTLAASLMLILDAALGHAGHEKFGDGVHIDTSWRLVRLLASMH